MEQYWERLIFISTNIKPLIPVSKMIQIFNYWSIRHLECFYVYLLQSPVLQLTQVLYDQISYPPIKQSKLLTIEFWSFAMGKRSKSKLLCNLRAHGYCVFMGVLVYRHIKISTPIKVIINGCPNLIYRLKIFLPVRLYSVLEIFVIWLINKLLLETLTRIVLGIVWYKSKYNFYFINKLSKIIAYPLCLTFKIYKLCNLIFIISKVYCIWVINRISFIATHAKTKFIHV